VVEGEDLKTNLLWRNVRGHKMLRTVRAHAHNGLVAGSSPAEPTTHSDSGASLTRASRLRDIPKT